MNAFGIGQAFSSWYGIIIMGVLAGISIYMVSLMIVRFIFFRKIQMSSKKIMSETQKAIHENNVKRLSELRGQRANDPPVRILVGMALANSHFKSDELNEIMRVTRIRQRERLTKALPAFGTIAAIAPFLGLLGTVMGIVESFTNLAQSGAAGPNVVASGVAAALWTTAAGIIVAVPAVVAYNVFKTKATRVLTEMEVVSRELMILFKTERVPKMSAINVKEASNG